MNKPEILNIKLTQLYVNLSYNIDIDSIKHIYAYGSHVYGSNNKDSDVDYIVIVDNMVVSEKQVSVKGIDFNIYTEKKFREKLDNHDIDALECYFLYGNSSVNHNIILTSQTELFKDFKIDLSKLRSSISAISSNSWVKAKKKIILEHDRNIDIGIKSLYHSLRILEFGCQIAAHGKIVNYGALNVLKSELIFNSNLFIAKNAINYISNPQVVCEELWKYLNDTYKDSYNTLATAFRKLAPKEIKK